MHKHYIVVAHKAPEQVERLVRHLLDGESEVWLHVDAKADAASFREVSALPGVHRVLPAIDCVWGGFSMVETTIASLRSVLASNRPGYVILLSGQDYPVASAETVRSYLAAHPRRLHLEAGPIERTWPDQYREKVDFYCLPMSSRRGDLALLAPLNRMTPRGALGWTRRLVRTFGVRRGLAHAWRMRGPRRGVVAQQFGGSQWWAMPWDAAHSLIGYVDAHPAFVRYFQYSQCPDETFFATALMQLDLEALGIELVSRNLHYIDWSYGDWERPKTLGVEDLPVLEAQPDGVLFARKFDIAHDARVLDLLDAWLQERGAS